MRSVEAGCQVHSLSMGFFDFCIIKVVIPARITMVSDVKTIWKWSEYCVSLTAALLY